MINEYYAKKFCCEDISLIENYEKAIADDKETWVCHHRLGIELNKNHEELKAIGLYENRPASELIFLTRAEHNRLHNTGISLSDKHCAKISASHKGKKLSAEHCAKISDGHKGKKLSAEHRAKISAGLKGKKRPDISAMQKGKKRGPYKKKNIEN